MRLAIGGRLRNPSRLLFLSYFICVLKMDIVVSVSRGKILKLKTLSKVCNYVSSLENKNKKINTAHFFINSHNCMWAKEIKKYGYPAQPIFKKKSNYYFFK
jgi:hypothetical protein